jgi:Flp pilus assembly protein TadG
MRHLRRFQRHRRGSITALGAICLVSLMALAGFLLSMSYIELARAELQAATDASAQAAVVNLAATQSTSQAQQAARDIAARYDVGSSVFGIANTDITFGNSAPQPSGGYTFTAGGSPSNAARVIGRKTTGSTAGPLSLPLGAFVNVPTFSTQQAATATRLDYDIVLVLDRSASMAWDLTANQFSYPGSQANRPLLENYFTPPAASGSRWAVLSSSVSSFLNVLSTRGVSARVALVSFASDYTFGNYSSVQVTRNCDLTGNYTTINTAMTNVGKYPVIGATNITAGLQEAQNLLATSSNARPRSAQPIVVLFSDGMYTVGGDPTPLASSMYSTSGIVIHTIAFGGDVAGQNTMSQIAAASKQGLAQQASTASQLTTAFNTIASALPVVLTE